MKRAISFILCLIMCFSLFSSTAVQVAALGTANRIFSVTKTNVVDGKITFTVSLNSGVEGFSGSVVLIEYDNTVLSPFEFAPAYKNSTTPQFGGIYVDGAFAGSDNVYSVGYMNQTPEKVSKNTEFFNITFEVISEERANAKVDFYCREFLCTSNPEQSITIEDGLQPIASFGDISTLEAPKLKSATLVTNGITLKWDSVVGATEYEILRKTSYLNWVVLGRVSALNTEYTDFNLESGNTYDYTVRAVNASGISPFDSNGVSCKFVSKPTNITVKGDIGGVEISWSKANGVDKYQIVRRESAEDDWAVIAEPSNSKTSYKDTSVENGKTYEYDVNSVLGSFVTDSISDGAVVTYLTAPNVTSVTNINEGIELKWENIDNVAYFVVYRKVVGAQTEFSVYQPSVTSNYFVDTDVENGKAYAYSVQAVSSYGDESAFTKTGYTITRVPSTVVTNLVAQADGIDITWEARENIDGYNIYRRTDDSDWEKVGGAPKGTTAYKDKYAKSGQEYFYCVAPCVGSSESARISSFQSVYFLAAPKNVKAVNIKNAIKVTWSESEGATEYHIYRQDGDYVEFVGTVSGTETEFLDYNAYTDSVYSYYVKASSIKGESLDSNKTPGVKRIDCVERIKTEVLYEGVLVTWIEQPFADSYIVCRKNNGVWKRIAETDNLEYIDANIESGETYGYSVIPVVDGYEGGIDEEIVTEFKYLSSTSIVDKELTTDSIKISWDKVDGAKKYEIQRAALNSSGERSGAYEKIATVDADKSNYSDKKVKAGKGYIYRVFALDGEARSLASTECKATFLATQSVKSLSNAYGGVKITWSASAGAKNYRIYRKENDGEWIFVKKLSGSKRSYVDKGAENGVKTYYAVKAQNGDDISTYKAKSFTYFASPEVTLANNTSAITVTWDKISGAKSYYVYRKTSSSGSWKKVATVSKNIYTDRDVKNSKTYYYTVKAYNGDILSAYNTDGWKIKRLSAPALNTIKNSTSGITISWSKVTGASKYIVMRKTSGSGWEEIKTTTSLSFTDTSAKAGKIYTYTVKAGSGNYRSTYIANGLKMKRLERPSLSSVKSSKSGVTFKWKEVAGASGYFVYRKTGSGAWEEIAKLTGASSLSYVDKSAKKGKTYYYSVRAYSGSYKSAYNTKGLKIKDKY